MPRCQQNHTFHKSLKSLAKQGIPGQNKEKQNNDKNTICLPRQDKRVDCIFPQRGAVLGKITAYKKARYYGIATNEVLEPKI
nr:MAG TPA: hypothetical protein [Caudoviricetes sp.]